MIALFSLASLLNSSLLFWLEPMLAKMLLPLLGGTPAVWNTCMLFFQAVLLAGYVFTLAAASRLSLKLQAGALLALMLLALWRLPVAVPSGAAPPPEAGPTLWLLTRLGLSAGLPFFVLSANGPMLQKWLAGSGHPAGRDPYFLYSAGSLGSIGALLAYPLFLERRFSLSGQARAWSAGFAALLVLTAACAAAARGAKPAPFELRLASARRLRWAALAAVPSSLLLGVTTYISTDLAPLPLLWILPLALYLLTFALAFSPRFSPGHALALIQRPLFSDSILSWILPSFILLLSAIMIWQAAVSVWWLIGFHLVLFFCVALFCHGLLAKDRPPAGDLPEFYLWLALGGAAGGMFNALLAPLLFKSALEYPLVLALACLFRPEKRPQRLAPADLAIPALLGLCAALLPALLGPAPFDPRAWLILPGLACFALRRRPVRFGLGLAALIAASARYPDAKGAILHQERSFFGIHRVVADAEHGIRWLYHGSTIHGAQSGDPARGREPLTYYHPSGPLGDVFAAYARSGSAPRVAVVGLGAGSMASYGRPPQRWTFYEIDPAVARIALNPAYFSFLKESRVPFDVVLGDARLSLSGAADGRYGLLVVDAFGSDAVPLHLLTREALRLYLAKLDPSGLLAFHVSNRYLDLAPILGDLAADAGLPAWSRTDFNEGPDPVPGKFASQWVLLARRPPRLDPRWRRLEARPGARAWSDDLSDVLSLLRN